MIVWASVEIDSWLRQVTDADGQFRFVQIQPGRHQVGVRRLGYDALITSLVLDTGAAKSMSD